MLSIIFTLHDINILCIMLQDSHWYDTIEDDTIDTNTNTNDTNDTIEKLDPGNLV